MIKSKAEERKLKLDAEQEDEKEKYRRFIERFECGALRTIFHTTMGVHWTNPSGLFDPSFEIPKELVEEEKKDPDDDDPEAAEAESNTDSAPSFNPNASTMSALTVDTNLKDVAGAKNEKKITITLPNQEQQTPPKTAPNHNQNSILRRRSSLPGASPKKMFGPQAVDEEVPPPPNEHWPGIKVHKRRVVKIDLHENNLMGSLPGGPGQGIFPQTTEIPPFGTTKTLLDELRVFIMFKNDLSGPIPASYSNFKVLQHLDLSYNRLTLLPEEIFSILTLKRIHLEKNYVMEGTIPAEIGDLKNLVSMTVQNNSLSGELPAEIINCKKMTELSVHHNHFVGNIDDILESLCELPQLEVLFLNNNELDFAEGENAIDITYQKIYKAGNFNTTQRCQLNPQHEIEEEDSSDDDNYEESQLTIDFNSSSVEGEKDF